MAYVEVSDPRPHVRQITLNRPERMNAMSFDTIIPLREALEAAGQDNDCWVVILTGNGRRVLLRAGPGGRRGPTPRRRADPVPPGHPGHGVLRRHRPPDAQAAPAGDRGRSTARPSAAACACRWATDIRIAGQSAYWRAAGINNGLGAVELGLSWTLSRAIGSSRAFEICLSGRDVHAEEAERIGLVSRTVPDAELLDTTYELAERICGFSTHGVSMTKKVLWSALEVGSLEAALDMENRNQLLVRLTTQNLEEYIRSRREGRTPTYLD